MRLVLVRIMNMVRALMYMMCLEIREIKYNQITDMSFLLTSARPNKHKILKRAILQNWQIGYFAKVVFVSKIVLT